MNVLTRQTLAVAAVLLVFGGPAERATAQEPTGLRADLIRDLTGVERKYVALAEALSADQYSWRPMKGTRSAGEVFMHIAGANVLFPTFVGVEAPDDIPEVLRSGGESPEVPGKAEVIEALHAAFEHARNTVRAVSDEDLDRTTTMFGQPSTYRKVLLLMTTHCHEHLGQQIAYARANGVAPPWSMGGG